MLKRIATSFHIYFILFIIAGLFGCTPASAPVSVLNNNPTVPPSVVEPQNALPTEAPASAQPQPGQNEGKFSISDLNSTLPSDVLKEVAFSVQGGPDIKTEEFKHRATAKMVVAYSGATGLNTAELIGFASKENVRIIAYTIDYSTQESKALYKGFFNFQVDSSGHFNLTLPDNNSGDSFAYVAIGEQSGDVYQQNEAGSFMGFRESVLTASH